MMIITDITKQKRNEDRCNVYVDGAFSFAASRECIIKNDLHIDTEISRETIDKIIYEDEYKKALDYAVKRLSYKQFSKNQLVKILNDKGYDDKTISKVTEKLTEYSYLDDAALSRMIVSDATRINRLGKRAIYSKMLTKKIDSATAKAALESVTPEMETENALELMQKYAARFVFDGKDIKIKQKIYRALLSKGYNWDTINDVFLKYEAAHKEED